MTGCSYLLSRKWLALSLKNIVGNKALFSNLSVVINGFRLLDRVIWIEIMGLPCYVWNDAAISKVASLWGEICFLEEDNLAPMAVKRVCIKYSKPSLIHAVLNVKVQRMQYEAVVWELSNWEPNILHGKKDLDWDIPHLSVR